MPVWCTTLFCLLLCSGSCASLVNNGAYQTGIDAHKSESGVSYGTGEFALGLKTCKFFHDNRLKAVYQGWASRVQHRVFGTDAMVQDPEIPSGEVVVVPDNRDSPYYPPWSQNFEGDPDEIDPFSLPLLTAKMGGILEALWDRFEDKVDWFVVADDDTFIRVKPLQAYLSRLDHTQPLFIGTPVPSDQFLRPADLQRLGPSMHCGGGAGLIFSKAALRQLRPHIDACLQAHHTILYWYSDEVEFARCLYEVAGLNCTSPMPTWGGEVPGGMSGYTRARARAAVDVADMLAVGAERHEASYLQSLHFLKVREPLESPCNRCTS